MNEKLEKLLGIIGTIAILGGNFYLATIGTNDLLFYLSDLIGVILLSISLVPNYKSNPGAFWVNAILAVFFVIGIARLLL